MSSVIRSSKQTNGYFVATTTGAITAYVYSTAGSGAGGSWNAGVLTTGTVTPSVAGAVFKDMGKTVLAGAVGTSGTTALQVNGVGPRVFRKVQYVNQGHAQSNGTSNPSNGINSGFAGTDTLATSFGAGYDTFFIELPVSGSAVVEPNTLIYVPAMPGFGY